MNIYIDRSENEIYSQSKAQISPMRTHVNKHTRMPILDGSGFSNIYLHNWVYYVLIKTLIDLAFCSI